MATNGGYIAEKYNAFDVYQAVFGYKAVPFPQTLAVSAARMLANPSEKLSKLGAVLFKRDTNGIEAFCPVTIVWEKNVNGAIKQRTFDLPYSTVAITMRKNIQKTSLIGRNGSVKELIQIEDYEFTINGVMLGSNDEESDDFHMPQTDLANLNELFQINEPVQLQNAFVEIFMPGDNTVVVESIDLPDMKGITGAQAYSIRVSSDTILELEE